MVKQQIVIAIIDDDAAVRVGLEKLLGAFGYRIEPHTLAEEVVHAPITASRFLTSLPCRSFDNGCHEGNWLRLRLAAACRASGFKGTILKRPRSDGAQKSLVSAPRRTALASANKLLAENNMVPSEGRPELCANTRCVVGIVCVSSVALKLTISAPEGCRFLNSDHTRTSSVMR